MPSRPAVAAIVAFWVATVGTVVYRDVLPRLTASGAPPVAADLSDEATQLLPVRWKVSRNGKDVGRLTTRMSHNDADDTFDLTSRFTNLKLDVAGARVHIPDLTATTRVTRAGELRGQEMAGQLVVTVGDGGRELSLRADGKVTGRVEGDTLFGRCRIDSPLGMIDRDLDPVPVPAGQVVSTLQVVNRIPDLKPGRSWLVREVNPLGDAVAALMGGLVGVKLGGGDPRPELLARVADAVAPLDWKGQPHPCHVIEYRGDDGVVARTWVRATDGRVLRQEAYQHGETLSVEREE